MAEVITYSSNQFDALKTKNSVKFSIPQNAHFCTKRCKGVRFFCVISAIFGTNSAFIAQNSVKLCSIREKFTIILQKVYENCGFSLKNTYFIW